MTRGQLRLGARATINVALSVTNIFEYSNILVTNIYSDIRSYQIFFYEYIQTFIRIKFVCTNIFEHSFVSVLECKN